jgi:CRP-like cAMP-binding protein
MPDRARQIEAMSGRGLDALIATLAARDHLSDEEITALKDANWRFQDFEAGTEIIAQHSKPYESCVLVGGIAARALYAASGSRQICALHIRGDFVDLHGMFLRKMDHAVVALTPCQAAFVKHTALREICATHPHLSRVLSAMVAIDAAMERKWIFGLGQLRGEARMASLFCGLYRRFEVVGGIVDHSFPFPLSQATLGDALGISVVHSNRSVQALRAANLITWRNGAVTILDWDGLAALAEFDPTYLNLFREER